MKVVSILAVDISVSIYIMKTDEIKGFIYWGAISRETVPTEINNENNAKNVKSYGNKDDYVMLRCGIGTLLLESVIEIQKLTSE
ncbi:MAG: hypothetical protein AAGU27_19785 [Dehalobacterium sp.]